MQRRSKQNTSDLPLITADIGCKPTGRSKTWQRATKRHQKKNPSSALFTCGLFLLFIVAGAFLLTHDFNYVSHHPVNSNVDATKRATSQKALSQYKSLQYALANADIVALYFAASWCSMSTPVTESIEKIFSTKDGLEKRVLKPNLALGDIGLEEAEHKDLAIVYVSSDRSEKSMLEYSRWNWINIPFSSEEKSDIKRQYRTCAKVEMEDLGIEPRRYHIPTLIIIDSATQGILSTNGVDELDEYGDDVLDHWIQLQQLARSLEDKYER